MANVTLTMGMRQNLLSLQSTNVLQELTQNRLATGKKVNSALDNPTNFFTALSHNNRANDLLGFKDGISEAIQTIKTADASISAITKLIESAKAVANDAKGVLGGAAASQTLTINTLTGISAGNTISIGGSVYAAVAGTATSTQFNISGSTDAAAISLANAINITIEAGGNGNMTASVSGSKLTITPTTGAMTVGSMLWDAGIDSAVFTESDTTGGAELTAKVAQYNGLMTQLNNLQDDAFYKGKNLLDSSDMTVDFGNNKTLVVEGFNGAASGLLLPQTATTWSTEALINDDIDLMDGALTTLRIESSKLSGNLGIINARDEWLSSVAETLQAGAAKLTLADSNEEGANMLMLQTRQSISTSALSMSAQAAQSVLRLFQ